jgi:hypothetical protein
MPASPKRWLFSAPIDLAVFGGTALFALALVWLGPHDGGGDSPAWTWVGGILLVDVAHVWSTAFVVYLDPHEWGRRKALYIGVPLACFAAGLALYACGEDVFWRAIAYVAVFHFIRQQYGWVMLYRARNGERDTFGRWLDGATIYACALYPLIWWHASLPRTIYWMAEGDFISGLPYAIVPIARAIYIALLVIYAARAVWQGVRGDSVSWGKHVVVAATAACWYNGIVAHDTDYAFTVSNVFTHGIPYMVLVFMYARSAARQPESADGTSAKLLRGRALRAIVVFLATVWFAAYVEEMVWDRTMWHDHVWLFGAGHDISSTAGAVLAPLLAVPQLVHYALDAMLWKRKSNPRLGRLL